MSILQHHRVCKTGCSERSVLGFQQSLCPVIGLLLCHQDIWDGLRMRWKSLVQLKEPCWMWIIMWCGLRGGLVHSNSRLC